MPTFSFPEAPLRLTTQLLCRWNAPLPDALMDESEASASDLMPGNLRRRTARPVSYYALF